MIEELLPYIQIGISLLLIIAILFQRSESGVGGAFGGGDSTSAEFRRRRGFERFLFIITIFLTIVFLTVTILPLFL